MLRVVKETLPPVVQTRNEIHYMDEQTGMSFTNTNGALHIYPHDWNAKEGAVPSSEQCLVMRAALDRFIEALDIYETQNPTE